MVSVRPRHICIFLILIAACFRFGVVTVLAVDSCTATVSPSSVQTSTDTNFSFSITNTGTQTINTVKITAPSSNISLENYGVSGWSINSNSTFAELTGNTVTAGATLNFSFHGTSGGTEVASADWLVQTNTGSGLVSCTGSLGTAISGIADRTAPEISDLAVSDITNTTATISWTTNEAATSNVNYGLTEDYGTAAGDNTLVTAHSVTLTSLTENTTYSFAIYSSDATGNMARNEQNTLTTASVTSAGTTTITNTVTSTVTNTVSETVTKTVVLSDTIKPVVKVNTALEKPYATAPIIEGRVVDSGSVNVGVNKVQYSVDDGKNWILVDEPSGASKVDFAFVPEVSEDGNYIILVRAIDKTGNVGVSTPQTLIIDRLPPRIIHSLWRVGPVILSAPYKIVTDVPIQVTVQGVGGVTEMTLLLGSETFFLTKNLEMGLWEGEIRVKQSVEAPAVLKAKDGGGAEVSQNMGTVSVISPDKVSPEEAEVSVYRFDDLLGLFKLWNGEPYGQTNPKTGGSSWFLPPGKYYFSVAAKRYITLTSMIFDLDQGGVVELDANLSKRSWWKFWEKGGKVEVRKLTHEKASDSSLVGKQILWLEKTHEIGKELNLMIVTTWDPRVFANLSSMSVEAEKNKDQNYLVVIPGANKSTTDLILERGKYNLRVVADPDGEILQGLSEISLPTILKINRRGVVESLVN